jgi:hypothetical protein
MCVKCELGGLDCCYFVKLQDQTLGITSKSLRIKDGYHTQSLRITRYLSFVKTKDKCQLYKSMTKDGCHLYKSKIKDGCHLYKSKMVVICTNTRSKMDVICTKPRSKMDVIHDA